MRKKLTLLLGLLFLSIMTFSEGIKISEEGIDVEINFEVGSNIIKESSFTVLDQLSEELKKSEYAGKFFLIEGHTDKTGDFNSNMELSKRRANAVSEYFAKKHGIAESRFVIRNYGSTKPLVDEDTPEAYAKNRRVAIKLRNTKNIEKLNDIVAFRSKGITFTKVVMKENSIEAEVPLGTDVTRIAPEIKVSGAKIEPASGVPQDFTNPVIYKVTSEDGTVKDYTVSIEEERPLIAIKQDTVKILADGKEGVKMDYTLTDSNGKVYNIPVKYYANGVEVKGNIFTTTVTGIYVIEARAKKSTSNAITIEAYDIINGIQTTLQKKKVLADGKETAQMNTIILNQNGTPFRGKTNETVKYFINGEALNGNKYATTVAGIYQVSSSIGEFKSKPTPLEFYDELRAVKMDLQKTKVIADGMDKIELKAIALDQNNDEMKNIEIEYYINNKKTDKKYFSETEPGKYNISASAGGITSTPQAVEVYEYFYKVELNTDKTKVLADGKSEVTITPKYVDRAGKTIQYDKYVVFVNGEEIKGNKFSTIKDGKYNVKIKAWVKESPVIEITAYDEPREIKLKVEKYEFFSRHGNSNLETRIFDQNKDLMEGQKYTVEANGKEIPVNNFNPEWFGYYNVVSKIEKLKSNVEGINVRPSYERLPLGVYIFGGYKQQLAKGVFMGDTKDNKNIYLFPGTGDTLALSVQYNFMSYFEVEGRIKQRTAIPDHKIKSITADYTLRTLDARLKIIPLRFEWSRIKLGGGIGYIISADKNIKYDKVTLDEKIKYKGNYVFQGMAEYEHFIMDDKVSFTLGAEYEIGSTVFENGQINSKDILLEDLKDDSRIVKFDGFEIYAGVGMHF